MNQNGFQGFLRRGATVQRCFRCLWLAGFAFCSGCGGSPFDSGAGGPDGKEKTSVIRELNAGWKYRPGDSPLDEAGRPLWALPDRQSGATRAEDGWRPYDIEEDLTPLARENLAWLRIRLPASLGDQPGMHLSQVTHIVDAYVDGRLVFQESILSPRTHGGLYILGRWPVVPLRGEDAGKLLSLRMYTGHTHRHGVNGTAYVGDLETLRRRFILHNADDLVIGALIGMAGLVLLSIALVRRVWGLYLTLGFFSLISGVYILNQNELVWLLSGFGHIWNTWQNQLLLLLPVGLLKFYEDLFDAGRWRWVRRAWQLHLGYFLLGCVAPQLWPSLLFDMIKWFYLVFVAEILVMLFFVIRRSIHNDADAHLLMIGFTLVSAAGIFDLLGAVGLASNEADLFSYGMFCFVLFLAIIPLRRFYRNQQRLVDLNAANARFVPRQFLHFLGKDDILEVSLGDQVQREMTVLFSDLRDFTGLSERLSPAENFALLNAYLENTGPVIRRNGGFIDKYIGDGIMALFPRRPDDALAAALEMRLELERFNAEGRFPALDSGIGIHTGSLMLGTVGETERMDTTVISDAVNLAARLEGLTRQVQRPIVLSQAARAGLEEPARFHLESLGEAKVKGKRESVAIFALGGPKAGTT